MKETVKTSRTAGYLEKLFRALNQDFFNGEVDEPIITIQSTPRAYGHCSVQKVWKVKDEERRELNMSADYLTRPIEETVATMLHEMVHLWNLKNNIQDCSRNFTYHNTKFRDKAREIGLLVDHDDRYGWTITSASEQIIDYIISKGWEEIQMNHGFYGGWIAPTGGADKDKGTQSGGKPTKGTGEKKGNSRKYVCPDCGMIVRATRIVRVKCADCDKLMIEE